MYEIGYDLTSLLKKVCAENKIQSNNSLNKIFRKHIKRTIYKGWEKKILNWVKWVLKWVMSFMFIKKKNI